MSFLQELAPLLAKHAAQVDSTDRDYASITLAAYLFASATYLRERYGSASMDTASPLVATDLMEALEMASNVSTSDPATAYLQTRGALLGLDQHHEWSRLVSAPLLPPMTNLDQLNDGDRLALFGRVRHWIRPRSGWQDARVHREELMPFVNVYPPRPSEELKALGMVWDRGEVPGTSPVVGHDLVVGSHAFRIALCPLFCGAHPRFVVSDEGSQFTIDPLNEYSDETALMTYLADLAPRLEAADVHLLVLPELSVTQKARAELTKMLQASQCLAGIVAGSFHMWNDGRENAPFNESAFLIPSGIAWTHHKLGYFRVSSREIEKLPNFFRQPLPDLQPRVVEGIRRGSELQFWDTRIGRLAVLICADAIARESLIPAVERCSPDLLLIPSLSLETDEFVRLGESLTRRGISVVYLNASTACDLAPNAPAAFVHLALPTPASAPPARVVWKRGAQPIAQRFKSHKLIEAPPDGFELLQDDVLIFDLNQHLRWREIPAH